MNIYVDVDGVLIRPGGKTAAFADEFLTYILTNWPDNTYWLTSYCWKGKNDVDDILGPLLRPKTRRLIKKVQPTFWEHHKTDGINFREPFLWFDDNLFPAERALLESFNSLACWRHINLADDPNQLIDETAYLQTLAGS